MLHISLTEIIEKLTAPYSKRFTGAVSDVRESIALVDLYIRIVYTIVVSESHRDGTSPTRVLQTPGVGAMLAVIRGGQQWNSQSKENWFRAKTRECAVAVSDSIGGFQVGMPTKSFKALRDLLSHGHALPEKEVDAKSMADELLALCEKLKFAINSTLGGCGVQVDSKEIRVSSPDKKLHLVISPLWGVNKSIEFGVFSHYSQDAIFYLKPGDDLFDERSLDIVNDFVKTILAEGRGDSAEINRFVRDVVKDIGAFTEDSSQPSYFFGEEVNLGCLFVPWVRSTSDENQQRTDVFRVGPDNLRQWRKGENAQWFPYSDFLREISNWNLLARRIGIGLEKFSAERDRQEISYLSGKVSATVRGPSQLCEVTQDLEKKNGTKPTFDLIARTDEACEVLKACTTVFFIVGQAGLGKTDLMLSMARERAKVIEKPSENKPLYLFVSSTGRTLSSLEDAINSSLNITKLLSSQGAKALCRNGMLVLLVDGFDELLGSNSYENALGSLEPWFRELGGRGVMVASARSSYYLTQYRKSLSETTGIKVDHTLTEIKPWSKDEIISFLNSNNISSTAWSELDERDWRLLSAPFFAKAFASWCGTNGDEANKKIFNIVVDQYLCREALKLVDQNKKPLLAPDELQSFFAEVAELMHQGKQRELELSDLVMCAQQVIGGESLDNLRPGLSNRLGSLCGFDVENGVLPGNKFMFSHEIMFDCFLSLALQKRTSQSVDRTYINNFFSCGGIHPAVFDWFVEGQQGRAQDVLELLISDNSLPNISEVMSDNVGSLWETLLRKRNGTPPTRNLEGLHLGEINLFGTDFGKLAFNQCSIELIDIQSRGVFEIDISNCVIDLLICENGETLKSSLKGVGSAEIKAIKLANSFSDTPAQINTQLELLGLVKRKPSSALQDWIDVADFFVDKLINRSDASIVVDADSNLPDDGRLNWTQRFGQGQWLLFLDKLERAKLVHWDLINAKGSKKKRLIFDVPPAKIGIKYKNDNRVKRFWEV